MTMARTPISQTLRAKLSRDIATAGYSDDTEGGITSSRMQSMVKSSMSSAKETAEEIYGNSTDNRAGWLATIADTFGFGPEETGVTPDSTYDEAGILAYSGIISGQPRDLASGDNFDYNLVSDVAAMADDSFTRSAEQVAANLNIPVNWMYAVMENESGFDPSIPNQLYVQQGREEDAAVGLIQFMPATARALGTSTEELRTMSRTEQLTYVERYLEQYADKIQSPEDVYMATFYPRALGEDDSFVLGSEVSDSRASAITRDNPPFDLNNDGRITAGEVKEFYRNSRGFNNFIAPFQSN